MVTHAGGRRQRKPRRVAQAGIWLGSGALILCLALAGCVGDSASHPKRPAEIRHSTPPPAPSPTPLYANERVVASCAKPSGTARMLAASQLTHAFVLQRTDPTSCELLVSVIPAPGGGVPSVVGQLILVNLTQQWLWAYESGRLVMASPVTTGMPYLRTPQGTFPVRYKVQDTVFYSPWPPGSAWYYTPEHVNYALYFRDKGFFIHDAPWRRYFGPGTEVPHTNPDGTQETGSHGCVNMPTPAGQWLYNWARVGATIVIAR